MKKSVQESLHRTRTGETTVRDAHLLETHIHSLESGRFQEERARDVMQMALEVQSSGEDEWAHGVTLGLLMGAQMMLPFGSIPWQNLEQQIQLLRKSGKDHISRSKQKEAV